MAAVSPTQMARLREHAGQRHAEPDGPLLRYATGAPLTSRRYDHLWTRIRSQLPWAAAQDVSTRWLRYATLTRAERNFGYATAGASLASAPALGVDATRCGGWSTF